jgi:hypothetical protein
MVWSRRHPGDPLLHARVACAAKLHFQMSRGAGLEADAGAIGRTDK